jgi:4-hydroxy-4-methyl-2-oxoglutarate aldolase
VSEQQTIIEQLTSTLAADTSRGQGALPHWISALDPSARLVGTVEPLWVQRDDNLAVRRLLESPVGYEGAVLVVAGASESDTAVIGGLTANSLIAAGFAGVVTDGLVRDAAELVEGSLRVWCRGVTSVASRKQVCPPQGDFVMIGGVPARRGDLLIADRDGVIIWPADSLTEYTTVAERLAELEAAGQLSPIAPAN